MSFPCSHCGSEESFADRKSDEFKPIIPVELQGDFEEPPGFISDPSMMVTPLSTESKATPVVKPPIQKESSGISSTTATVSSSKSKAGPDTLEGPPKIPLQEPILEGPPKMPLQDPSSSKPPIKESLSRVVDGMVTKTEDASYRNFVKNRFLEIDTILQNIQSDIKSLIEGQKQIESMLIEEIEKSEKKKKGRWKK